MNLYEKNQASKKARFESLAASARTNSNATFTTARNLASLIPLGQPILVGHYSEQRDRNFRSRISGKYEQAFKLEEKANHYAEKAASVGTGGVSSDDPDAISKLTVELEDRQAKQTSMKAANKLKAGSYKGFELSNNNAQIQRITKRIESLKAAKTRAYKEITGANYVCKQDPAENRLLFVFDGVPSSAIRDTLKRSGFKWSPTRSAWVRMLNNAGVYAAQEVMRTLNKPNDAL